MDIERILKAEVASYQSSEWTGVLGGEEITLYARPLSPADVKTIRRKFPEFTTQPEPAAMVEAILLKAKDEHGNTVFKPKHGAILNRCKTDVIGNIFEALFGDQFTAEDESEFQERVGNSEKT